jgi:hypothetical protein
MTTITATMVKDLREKTGAGFDSQSSNHGARLARARRRAVDRALDRVHPCICRQRKSGDQKRGEC